MLGQGRGGISKYQFIKSYDINIQIENRDIEIYMMDKC